MGRINQPEKVAGSSSDSEMLAYQKVWQSELPGDPQKGLVGLGFALLFFICFISFPWVISFLQDEGLIKPQVQLRFIPAHPVDQESRGRSEGTDNSSVFGAPRQ